MFEGLFPALITPFSDKGIATEVLNKLVVDLISSGVDGVVPLGTTGEIPTLSNSERDVVITICVEAVAGRVPVIAGTGTNSTEATIKRTKRAAELGATGALVICPYYNKPTQEGLYRHFTMIADASPIPLILYNIPGRTSVNMTPQTLSRLCGHERITAIKEASGNLDQISEMAILCGDHINILAGDDTLILPTLTCGGKGAISAAANIVPRQLKDLMKQFFSGKVGEAIQAHLQIWPLLKALFIETNPIAVKETLCLMGYDAGQVRPPLAPLSEDNRQVLIRELKGHGIIKE
ncbi:4-hydroxy-tetrahydrodipicolinate synthase [candidate division LCP-89 bacterium B3_LCP]|uniref:4-hydroxy-tetrahydrodipicolinate synthase n=1 Tax=candidate division LCP-89 bacterium B3_LCP TaxID=2012998 RepID=A0A532URK3_UNCL8|nr:MAG: 4-hydroxy-tetrahydrodipicolinate synthase [candidate division LCP-89 bacterium B3_LCP]